MTDPHILHTIGDQLVVGLDIPARVVHVNEKLHGEMHIQRDFLKSLVREVLEERDAQVRAESSVPLEETLDRIRDAVRQRDRDIERVRRENALLREEYDLPDPMEIFDRLKGWPVHIDGGTGIVTLTVKDEDYEVQTMPGMISAFNHLTEIYDDQSGTMSPEDIHWMLAGSDFDAESCRVTYPIMGTSFDVGDMEGLIEAFNTLHYLYDSAVKRVSVLESALGGRLMTDSCDNCIHYRGRFMPDGGFIDMECELLDELTEDDYDNADWGGCSRWEGA